MCVHIGLTNVTGCYVRKGINNIIYAMLTV